MTLYASADILQAAQVIRPYLNAMLDNPQQAEAIGQRLDRLIAQAEMGTNVDNQILAAMAEYPATRTWLAKALPLTESIKGTPHLPGKPDPVPATQTFACPQPGCTFTWTRRYATQPVPPCPVHGCELEEV